MLIAPVLHPCFSCMLHATSAVRSPRQSSLALLRGAAQHWHPATPPSWLQPDAEASGTAGRTAAALSALAGRRLPGMGGGGLVMCHVDRVAASRSTREGRGAGYYSQVWCPRLHGPSARRTCRVGWGQPSSLGANLRAHVNKRPKSDPGTLISPATVHTVQVFIQQQPPPRLPPHRPTRSSSPSTIHDAAASAMSLQRYHGWLGRDATCHGPIGARGPRALPDGPTQAWHSRGPTRPETLVGVYTGTVLGRRHPQVGSSTDGDPP